MVEDFAQKRAGDSKPLTDKEVAQANPLKRKDNCEDQ